MKTISAIEFATDNVAHRIGAKKLNPSEFYELRNAEYQILVSDGVLNDTDKNFTEFDKLLGKKLSINWD